MKIEDFCEISIEIFLNMSGQLPFDVFVQLGSDKFTQVFKRNDLLDRVRIENYLKKGAQRLYIHRKDRRDYIGATERFIKKMLDSTPIFPKDAVRAVEELTEQTLFEIFEDKLFDDQLVRRAQEVVKSFVQALKEDITLLTKFVQLARNETYMVRHSIATSVFALLIGRAADNTNDRTLQIIGAGGLLHDVGMAQLPPEINDVDRKLSAEEWKLIKSHPAMGSQMTANIKDFPPEYLQVLEQHHEAYDGSGYPRGLKGEEIYYPARIVAIADCFSALTTRRGGRCLFRPEDALSLMLIEKHRYDPRLLTTFENLLKPAKKKKAA